MKAKILVIKMKEKEKVKGTDVWWHLQTASTVRLGQGRT
jgi:hypothetical protein